MTTFLASQSQLSQEHFTVVEIDLPVVEGACTISGESGYGTPLSCDQASNATRTYKFTDYGGVLPESDIFKVITTISETPTRLKSGKGLSGRGTASVGFSDFIGDPNTDAPAVDSTVKSQGTFFSKLDIRQVLENKPCRIKNYRVESNGTIDLDTGAEERHYIIESLDNTSNGKWILKLKDELSRINIDDSVWPIPLGGFLRNSIGITQTSIPVDAVVTYVIGDTIRVGDEFMKVIGVSNIGTGSASLTVQTRGTNIDYTNTLTRTVNDTHSLGDEVYVCEVSDNETIDDLLERVLTDIGVDPSFIPKSDWTSEISEWHPNDKINTLWYESEDTSEVLEKILTNFMLDMWFDPVDREVKLTAISQWQSSDTTLTEGNEINFESVKRKREEGLRSTRAYVVYDKPFLATSTSVENYKKASLFKRTELETTDLFGEPKTKRFDFTHLISKDAADLLVNRWVNRYIDPFSYVWTTPERKRLFKTGDIVDIKTNNTVGFDGASSGTARAQITSIKPMYTNVGREYKVEALAYEPVFATGSEIIISGSVNNVNLYIQYAGAPSSPVEITFIFDASLVGSNSGVTPSIKAGAFPVGSKIIMILANGADLQGKGGDGGRGGGVAHDPETGQNFASPSPTNGDDGSIVYSADGVDTDIYFSGATPSASFPVADGYIRAPSGGSGGFDSIIRPSPLSSESGDGGDGGDGRFFGVGGLSGFIDEAFAEPGAFGVNGSELGVDWGIDGSNNNATGGTKGKGVVDSGAVVTFFGDTPVRYINGGGDH